MITVTAGSLQVGEDSRVDLGDGGDRIEAAAAALLGGFLDTGRDTLVLPTGVYAVDAGRISTTDALLPVRGVNVLAGLSGGSFRYAPGTLTVDAAGMASFVPEA